MHRLPLPLLGTTLALCAAVVAQSPSPKNLDVNAYWQARHGAAKPDLRAFLADVARDGLVASPRDVPAWKQAFHSRNGKARTRTVAKNTMQAGGAPVAGGAPAAVALEFELNGSNSRPDSMGGQPDYDGSLSSPSDQDFVTFDLATDARITLAVNASGSSPNPDPDVTLLDADGQFIAYDDDSVGLYPRLTVTLPAGSYRAVIGTIVSNGVGSYRLTLTSQAATIPVLVPNQPVNDTFSGGLKTFRMPLAPASAISLTATSATLDCYMSLNRRQVGQITFLDDSSTGLDSKIDTHLQAGLYYVIVGEYNAANGPFTMRVTATPSEPLLACSGSVSGNFVGDETMPVWKTTLATAQDVIFGTSAGTAPAATDTVVTLYDSQYAQICFNDDMGAGQYFSRTGGALPAGIYYVQVKPYYGDTDNFNLALTCNAPTGLNGEFGLNTATLSTTGLGTTFSVTMGTPSPFDAHVTDNSTSGSPQMAILDNTGRCVAFNDDVDFDGIAFAGAPTVPGRYHVLVHEYTNGPSACDVSLRPQIYLRNRVSDRTLVVEDKAGRQMHLLASIGLLPVPIPLPPPLMGNLLIDLSLHVYLGPQPVPASGTFNWPVSFQPFPVALQGLSVALPADLVMTQAVR